MDPERYSRQQTIVGDGGQALLTEKKVLIVGCGGLGGHLLENMLRIGVGHIVAVDPDKFEPSNLNRQLLSTVPLLGSSKAEAAAARAKAVDPEVEFRAVGEAFSPKNADELVRGCDLALDGLDNVSDRLLLEDVCARHRVPLVHGAIEGELLQAAVVPPGSGMLHTLYVHAAFGNEANGQETKASIAYTPACCAAIQCAQALKLLLGERPPLWGKFLQLNLGTMTDDIVSLPPCDSLEKPSC